MEMTIRFPHLGLEFSNVGRIISISGFEITIYGIFIAAALLAGVWLTVLTAKRTNQDQNSYLLAMILEILFGMIGARLYYVICNWDAYQNNVAQIWNFRSGGMAIYGGILAGIAVLFLYCRIRDLSFDKMADTSCMGLLAGQIIGRWGDFFSREGFGEYTDHLLCMQLPVSAVNSGELTEAIRKNAVTIGETQYIQVHPTFLYEILWNLVLLFFLSWYRKRRRFEGELFWIYLTGYGIGRAWIEVLRTDKLFCPGTEISLSFLISAALAGIGILVISTRRMMTRKRMEVLQRRREALEALEKQEEIQKQEIEDFWDFERSPKEEKTSEDGENVHGERGIGDTAQENREEEGTAEQEDPKQGGSGEESSAQ